MDKHGTSRLGRPTRRTLPKDLDGERGGLRVLTDGRAGSMR